jgi:hypothetical protein
MSFFDTLSDTAGSIKSGFNTLMNGSGPATKNNMAEGIAELRKYDVGRTAYFKVEIFSQIPPDQSSGNFTISGGSSSEKSLSFLCHSAELPGESTATVTQKIYGVTEKFSVMTGYNDITLAFYTRGSGVEITRKFFQKWISFITGRAETINYRGKKVQETTYNVQYKADYVGTVKITHFAITGDPLVEVTLYDAFPVSINQVPLSWSAQNEAQSLNVTFAYTEYSYNFLSVEGTGNYSRGPLGELLGTAIQTAATINSIKGAFKSGNPVAATSTLPNLGLSNFTISSGLR